MPEQIIPTINHIKPENLQRNLQNLAKLLPLGKVEEVRLVYVNDFFDAKALIKKVATLLTDYPDVLLKLFEYIPKAHGMKKGLNRLFRRLNKQMN
ncbi:pyruvate-formate lyase-activating enzyme [Actinobacillus equuli]|nr:pyruvate-formate lyase-activating enzyme [Actinobacillus equuli]